MNFKKGDYTEKDYYVSPELTKLADHAISRAKAQMELQGDLTPIFIFRRANGSLFPIDVPPHVAEAMDSGDKKDAILSFFRLVVHGGGYTGSIFCTDAWFTEPTEKGKKLSGEEFEKLYQELTGEGLAKAGYSIRREVLCCTVQTPERCLVRRVPYLRGRFGLILSPPIDMEGPIDTFGGRQKMFGDLSDCNLGQAPDKSEAAKKQLAKLLAEIKARGIRI